MKNSSSVLSRHAAMVLDHRRTHPLAAAIRKTVKRGDIIVDIGTGVGLLALIAAQSGAKQVFAIDVDEEGLELGTAMAQRLGLAEKITFLHGLSFHLELDCKADVIICETIGSLAFDENILATLADAKQRLLKRGGKILPENVELWGVPVRAVHNSRYRPLTDWHDVEGLSFRQTSRRQNVPKWLQTIRESDFMATPQKLITIDFLRPFRSSLRIKRAFRILHSGALSGMGLWPRVRWTKGLSTDCAPRKPLTHWGQAMLEVPLQRVQRGELKTIELIVEPHPDDPLHKTEILWKTT